MKNEKLLQEIRKKIKEYQDLEEKVLANPDYPEEIINSYVKNRDEGLKNILSVLEEWVNALKPYESYQKGVIENLIVNDKRFYESLGNFTAIPHFSSALALKGMMQGGVTKQDVEEDIEKIKTLVDLVHENKDFLFNTQNHFVFTKPIEGYQKGVKKLFIENIYVFTDDSGLLKIGKAKDVDNRINTHKISNPTIQLLKSYEVLKTDKAEGKIHDRFAVKRYDGEFFTASFDEVDQFIRENYAIDHSQLKAV